MDRICPYCDEKDLDNFSKGHIFPQVIGGRVWQPCCSDCNKTIGHQVEGRIKENPFFVFGIDRLKLQKTDKAFRNLKISENETGMQLKYSNGKLRAMPKVKDDGTIFGDKTFVHEYLVLWTRNNRPHWEESVKKQLREGNRIINIAGDKFLNKPVSKTCIVNYDGSNFFPAMLLAKITYESLYFFKFLDRSVLEEFFQTTFRIEKKGKATVSMEVHEDFYKRVNCRYSRILDGSINLQMLKYHPIHTIDFRHYSQTNVAYVRIGFFGALSFTISIASIDKSRIANLNLLNKRLFFPIDRNKTVAQFEVFPDSYKDIAHQEDLAASARLHAYKEITTR